MKQCTAMEYLGCFFSYLFYFASHFGFYSCSPVIVPVSFKPLFKTPASSALFLIWLFSEIENYNSYHSSNYRNWTYQLLREEFYPNTSEHHKIKKSWFLGKLSQYVPYFKKSYHTQPGVI